MPTEHKRNKKKPGHEMTPEQKYNADIMVVKAWQEKERKKEPPKAIAKAFRDIQEYENDQYVLDSQKFRDFINDRGQTEAEKRQADISIGILYHLCLKAGYVKMIDAAQPVEQAQKSSLILPGEAK